MRRARARIGAIALALLLPALAVAHPTVLMSGDTLRRRTLPENILLPDGTTLRLGEMRALRPDARSDETLVYDLGTGQIERNGDHAPSSVLGRKSFGLSFLSVRDPEQGRFYAPRQSDLTGETLDQPDVLVVATEQPFLSRIRAVPEASAAWPALLVLRWLARRPRAIPQVERYV